MITCTRYHDFSCGHRVYKHEGKCQHLHGHNYRVHFTCQATCLDDVGRVIDFSVIKELLCEWLEDNWDHKFLIWKEDVLASSLKQIDSTVCITPFNPTAENMAKYLLDYVCAKLLANCNVKVIKIKIEETRKCSVEATR